MNYTTDSLRINALACGIPEYMIGGLVRWIDNHIEPGDFLRAVLSNDLRAACERADETNRYCIFDYVNFLHNHAPSDCWGSPEKMGAWFMPERAPS